MPCPSHLPSRTCPRCSLAYQQTSSTQRTVLTPPAPAYSAHPHSCTPNRVCACTSCAITTTAQYSVRAAYGSPNSSALRCRSYLSGTTSRVPSCSSSPASQNASVVLRSSRPTHRRLLGARIFFFFVRILSLSSHPLDLNLFLRRTRVSVSYYRCHPDGHKLSLKFSADRGCEGRRWPVASRTVDSTSSGIGIALHRVFLGRAVGT